MLERHAPHDVELKFGSQQSPDLLSDRYDDMSHRTCAEVLLSAEEVVEMDGSDTSLDKHLDHLHGRSGIAVARVGVRNERNESVDALLGALESASVCANDVESSLVKLVVDDGLALQDERRTTSVEDQRGAKSSDESDRRRTFLGTVS